MIVFITQIFNICQVSLSKLNPRTSLAVQWLRLHTSTAGDADSNPGRGSKALQALRHGAHAQKKYKPESLPTPTFETLKPVSDHSLHLICLINHSVVFFFHLFLLVGG